MIVAYCERINFGAEPVNALSNVAFVLPFVFGLYLLLRPNRLATGSWYAGEHTAPGKPGSSLQQTRHSSAINKRKIATTGILNLLLVALPLAIAGGSALFHAKPSLINQALDILPIVLFVLLTAWVVLRQACLGIAQTLLILACWMGGSALGGLWPEILAGSLFYVPTLLLLWFGCLILKNQRRLLLPIAVLFLIALVFRAIDLPLCATGRGTHALWHTFSAIVCCGLLVVCLRPQHRPESSG